MRRRAISLLVPALALAIVTAAAAADLKRGVTDPAEAGTDFKLQGEYSGESLTKSGDKKKYGAQVIALGDGKFHLVGYNGGLPGEGWDQGEKDEIDGETVDGVPTFSIKKGHILLKIKDGGLVVIKNGKEKIGELKKVARKSPTLGAKPPKGAVVLFDGTTPDAFKGGRMTEDKLLMEGATSKDNFGSCTLHIEFMTPFKPFAGGQGRGNSGFYAQGRYEVQILDSFGLQGKYNECGGLYEIAPPAVNMCFPPLSWQTYDVDFTAAQWKEGKKVKNARITVRHNGVVIHDDVELPRTTRAAPVKENDQPGPVYLQNHGNPVRFRNIWVKEKK